MNKASSSGADAISAIFEKAAQIRESVESAEKKVIPIIPLQSEIKDGVSTQLVGINGIKITRDGTITKTNFLQRLQVDDNEYAMMKFTEEEAAVVKRRIGRMTTGVNSVVPMLCSGRECAFASSCPYVSIGKAPIGKDCLVESQLIHLWTEQFMDEFDADPNKITEMFLISELAEIQIYEMRVTKYLAENHPTLLQDVVSTVDATGQEIVNKEISRAFDIKERLKKQRLKILESLMATREKKVKLNVDQSDSTDTATRIADLKDKLFSLHKDFERMKPIDVEVVTK